MYYYAVVGSNGRKRQKITLYGGHIMATAAKKVNKPVAPFYAVAAIWLGYSFLMGLHNFWDYLVVILLSVVVFRWLNTASAGDESTTETVEEKKEPETTGNAELDKMIGEFVGHKLAEGELENLIGGFFEEEVEAGNADAAKVIIEWLKTIG